MVVTEKLSLSLISNSRQVRAPEKLYVVVTKLAIIMDVAEILFDSTCFRNLPYPIDPENETENNEQIYSAARRLSFVIALHKTGPRKFVT